MLNLKLLFIAIEIVLLIWSIDKVISAEYDKYSDVEGLIIVLVFAISNLSIIIIYSFLLGLNDLRHAWL